MIFTLTNQSVFATTLVMNTKKHSGREPSKIFLEREKGLFRFIHDLNKLTRKK